MFRSLRTRLLILAAVGISSLALGMILVEQWSLQRVHDRAVEDSSAALQEQLTQSLQQIARQRAGDTNNTLRSVQSLAVAIGDYMAQTQGESASGTPPTWRTVPEGWRYAHGATTVLLPATNGDDAELIAALNSSRVLDSVLPVFLSNETAVLRGIYLSPGGAVRTYPSLDPSRLPSGWSVDQDVRYQAALPRSPVRPPVVWTATHRALDSNEIVVSAVVPMTQRGRFDGALAIDVSLARLTSYLTSLASDPVAMAFIVDGNGQLVATSESGRGYLQDEAQPLQTAVPALQKVINDTRIGNGGAMVDAVLDRPSIVAYAPISVANWSLVLVAPLDTITSRMQTITARTTAIASETGLWSVIGTVIVMVGLGGLFSLTLQRQFMRPLGVLTRATRDIAAGTLRHIPVTSADEMGQLATAFNGMTDALQASRAEIVAANQRLERTVQERTSDLQLTVARLEESFAAQQTLLQTLHAVSTPVIPVVAGVLAMPLIGQFDAERAQHARQELLARIERERAHTVLLDVTGVPLIDTAAAQALLQTVAASRLLGAEVLLVGVTPEVAQTLVALGIDLAGLRTAIDLQSAIEQLLVRGPARRGAAVR